MLLLKTPHSLPNFLLGSFHSTKNGHVGSKGRETTNSLTVNLVSYHNNQPEKTSPRVQQWYNCYGDHF